MSGHDDRLVRRAMQVAAGHDAAGPCPDAELLGLYAERALDEDERPALEAHVTGCARCQATVAAYVRSLPDGVPAGAAGGAVTGVADAVHSWWAGWRWLVPVAATAAVVTVAVWVQRPAAPDLTVAQERAAPATMAAPGAAAPSAVAPPSAAPADARGQSRQASPAPSAEPRGAREEAPAQSAAADAAKQTDALKKAEPFMRAEAPPVNPTAVPVAPPAEAPVGTRLADAREPSAPATPAASAAPPAPPAPAARVAEAEASSALRPAEAREANRADAAAPGRAKTFAGAETAAGRAPASVAAAAVRPRMVELTGRVTYRTRAALPPGAIIDVRLLDVSRLDDPAAVRGRVEIVTRGEQVPVPFTVGYDADVIDPAHRYTVEATITVDGRVAYRTTTAPVVLTSGAPVKDIEIVVQPVP